MKVGSLHHCLPNQALSQTQQAHASKLTSILSEDRMIALNTITGHSEGLPVIDDYFQIVPEAIILSGCPVSVDSNVKPKVFIMSLIGRPKRKDKVSSCVFARFFI
jgi:hypothetical protein